MIYFNHQISDKKTLFIPVGPSGSGKSYFAKKSRFKDSEIVSTDMIRKILTDNELDQMSNNYVFEIFHKIIDVRMRNGLRVYTDATNLKESSRNKLIDMADHYGYKKVMFIFALSKEFYVSNNSQREIPRPEHVIFKHYDQMQHFLKNDLAIEFSKYNEIYQAIIVKNNLINCPELQTINNLLMKRFERLDIII